MANKDTPVRYGVWYRCPNCNEEWGEPRDEATDQQVGSQCPGCMGIWTRAYLNAFRDFGMEHGYPVEQEAFAGKDLDHTWPMPLKEYPSVQ